MEYCFLLSIKNLKGDSSSHPDDFWCSFCQIGKSFYGETLTLAEYERVEALYIRTVEAMLEESRYKPFRVSWVENDCFRNGMTADDESVVQELNQFVRDEAWVQPSRLGSFLRVVLRGFVWCLFDWEDGSRVRVCSDYWTAVVCKLANDSKLTTVEAVTSEISVPPEIRVEIACSSYYMEDIQGMEDDDEDYYDPSEDDSES